MHYDILALIIWCTAFSINFFCTECKIRTDQRVGYTHPERHLILTDRLGEVVSLSYTIN